MGTGQTAGQEPEHFPSMPSDLSASKGTVRITHGDFVTVCVCVRARAHVYVSGTLVLVLQSHPVSHVPCPRQRGGGDAAHVQPAGSAHPLCAPSCAACGDSHCASRAVPCALGARVGPWSGGTWMDG